MFPTARNVDGWRETAYWRLAGVLCICHTTPSPDHVATGDTVNSQTIEPTHSTFTSTTFICSPLHFEFRIYRRVPYVRCSTGTWHVTRHTPPYYYGWRMGNCFCRSSTLTKDCIVCRRSLQSFFPLRSSFLLRRIFFFAELREKKWADDSYTKDDSEQKTQIRRTFNYLPLGGLRTDPLQCTAWHEKRNDEITGKSIQAGNK